MAEPIKAGWEDVGYGNLVRKTDTGQMVDIYHPIYTSYQAPQAAAPASTSSAVVAKPIQAEAPAPVTPAATPAPVGAAPTMPTTTAAGSTINRTQDVLNNPGQQGPPTTVSGAFQQALMSRLNPEPVSSKSSEIAPAIQANKLAEQRNLEHNRAMLAERAASQGLDQNAFNTQLTGLAENRAAREGQFAGQMTADLARQRAGELTAALALGGGMLSEQDRLAAQQQLAQLNAQLQREGYGLQANLANLGAGMQREGFGMSANLANLDAGLRREGYDLQEQLAQLEAQLRREGLSAQTGLGNRELDLRGELGRGQLNLGLLSSLLQNQQYGQGLGLQAGIAGANLNQQALLSLLNGL